MAGVTHRPVFVLLLAVALIAGCGAPEASRSTAVTASEPAVSTPSIGPAEPHATTSMAPSRTTAPTLTVEGQPSLRPGSCHKPKVHAVKAGDSLSGIAERYGVTVDALLAANAQILDPRLLHVGDAVTISPMDLGTLRGRRSTANDINERGEIVGQSETELGEPLDPTSDLVPTYESHAFIWRDGVMTDLGTLGGWRSSATSLNEHGEVVGTSDRVLDFGEEPFLWRDGVIASVWFASFSAGGTRPAINDLGQIALTVAEPDPEDPALELRRAFLWENGRTTPLGSLETGALAEAADLNNRGEVVGRSGSHAALWTGGILTDLGTLGGKTSSANAINDLGQVVGWSDTNSGNAHAFLWQNGTMTDLGTLGGDVSHATGLNDRGQVVGWSYTASGHTRAFLWQDGTMRDLGTLAGAADSPDFGPTDVTAAAINDCGEIVGSDHRPWVEDGHALLWFAPSR